MSASEIYGQNLSYSDIQCVLNEVNLDSLPVLNISILRTVMIDSITPFLRYHAYGIDHNAIIEFGRYDNIFQEAVGGETELLNTLTDVVLIFMPLESIAWRLARSFSSLSSAEVEQEIVRINEYTQEIIEGIRSQTQAMILWHGFETPLSPGAGIYDYQNENGQMAAIRSLNDDLKSALSLIHNAYFVDVDLCRARVGENAFYDLRLWHMNKAPYSVDGLREIATEEMKFIRPLLGRNKKCLVLDCDNTLWGGIIGEDNLSGIKIGNTYPGSCFWEFQQEIINLYERGIILALCSKNNEADVWQVFDEHPDMLLNREHIATARINWQDKVSNLRQIASDLNIALDSMVFMDDSEFEISMVRQELPEVTAIILPVKKPTNYRKILADCGFFDTPTVSEEDKKRGAMYLAENKRNILKNEAGDLSLYYESLNMEVEIYEADEFSISRIAQLTQKTNQFNLTTRRYSDSDIECMVADQDASVLYLRLKDRFGDSGIVGVCVLRFASGQTFIDSLLLSCRVLGRKVENIFVVKIMEYAKDRGATNIVGEYYATAKNEQVEFFFRDMSFTEIKTDRAEPDRVFQYSLDGNLPEIPDFFKSISFLK
ncbi:HAD-IIIC family phosphatase [Maridesulfovibrio zosterae]|uniref:HAD-IIIC family phosphatase n=1 Tax=Maridesulfovibrio zosterae TaxID=82171 RepID=UPI0004105A16|nr:HAD-IIIC family phosphatase [Maridesulfovibrio zosterae]